MKIHHVFLILSFTWIVFITNWHLDKDVMFILIFYSKIMTSPVGFTHFQAALYIQVHTSRHCLISLRSMHMIAW